MVAFVIKDKILFQEIKLKTSDIHIEVRVIELTSDLNSGGNNIKLVNTYIPLSSSCDAEFSASISKLIELDICIIVGDFIADSPLCH